ncbi:hypothetical protein NKI79_09570 [Mesorhizobium sp. M0340]|uniref:hypothetical protein n=1 Tax=Mesorhizobium sp. M0340 TaxID=2956939 RepID=UPI0033363D1B
MNRLIRGLMAATALASLTTIACAQDGSGVIAGLATELTAQYDGAPQKVLPSAWAAPGMVIVLLVSLYGRERRVSATI